MIIRNEDNNAKHGINNDDVRMCDVKDIQVSIPTNYGLRKLLR